MARRRSDAPSRGEISEKVETHEKALQDKGEDIEETVCDVETERDTLDDLELEGTAEAAEAVEQAIEGARGVSVQEFDTKSDDLEGLQDDVQGEEDDLHERSDTTATDLGKISDASGKIHSDAANGQLVGAKDAAMRDIDFLNDAEKRAKDAREESDRNHQAHRQRVDAGGRT